MYAQFTNKSSKYSAPAPASQKEEGTETWTPFLDNRAETLSQRSIQEAAARSPQAQQAAQLRSMLDQEAAPQAEITQRKVNRTGMPDQLKYGLESLSGYSMDNVRVHYNSAKPAQLHAHAYAQGTDIHLGPGQEKHLPHEAWHVVQQMQGRVQPTMELKGGQKVNDDKGLEAEADVMGSKAMHQASSA